MVQRVLLPPLPVLQEGEVGPCLLQFSGLWLGIAVGCCQVCPQQLPALPARCHPQPGHRLASSTAPPGRVAPVQSHLRAAPAWAARCVRAGLASLIPHRHQLLSSQKS